jgi:hypothetical protein
MATWLRVFRQAEELGVVQVNLTGGEPLVRDDLERLVEGPAPPEGRLSATAPYPQVSAPDGGYAAIGYPACFQASTPPRSAFVPVKPFAR